VEYLDDGVARRVRIMRVHMEEDAGKSIHDGFPDSAGKTYLDFNRSGVPLVEIVTQPDLRAPSEAARFFQRLRRILLGAGVNDGNMEEGSLRCDANVSVRPQGADALGVKVEIKNLNSFKFVRNALAFEIGRQSAALARGERVAVETRLWNENRDCTEPMRVKESEDDYRYFAEPDLPPFRPDAAFLAAVEERLVELPLARRDRLAEQYALPAQQAAFLTAEPETVEFFEQTVAAGGDASLAARWLGADIRRHLNRRRETFAASHLSPERLAALLELLAAGTVNGKIAKQVLATAIAQDRDPQAIVAQEGLRQVTDAAELQPVLDRVLAENPRVGEQLAAGDRKPVGFLVGQVMRHTAGRAHPDQVHGLIEALYAQQAAPEGQE
jgi:aspartyl-tRNA(Asn)/glutamyl-tRNA(Gln) amidotransferase subunit B